MENRVAVISIIVENINVTDQINSLLHEYASYIIGRMGVPYQAKNIRIISVALDAPQNEIATLSGKLGNLDGVTVKTAYGKC